MSGGTASVRVVVETCAASGYDVRAGTGRVAASTGSRRVIFWSSESRYPVTVAGSASVPRLRVVSVKLKVPSGLSTGASVTSATEMSRPTWKVPAETVQLFVSSLSVIRSALSTQTPMCQAPEGMLPGR